MKVSNMIRGLAVLVGMGAAALTGTAQADIIPSFQGVTNLGGGVYQFDYTADVTVNQRLETGDYFTIYDFADVLGAVAPIDWTWSVQNLGLTPGKVLPDDDAALPNVTFVYLGATPIIGPSPLGEFGVKTSYQAIRIDEFAGLGTRNPGPSSSKIANIGEIPVSAIPLPAAAWMGLSLLTTLGAGRALRSRTTKA